MKKATLIRKLVDLYLQEHPEARQDKADLDRWVSAGIIDPTDPFHLLHEQGWEEFSLWVMGIPEDDWPEWTGVNLRSLVNAD